MTHTSLRLVALTAALLSFACNEPRDRGSVGVAAARSRCSPGLDMAAGDPVAKVGDQVITCGELYEKNKAAIQQAEAELAQQVHQMHQQALEQLIDEKLLEKKAQAAGQSVQEYLEAEVGVRAPTDEEMRALYDQAAAQGQELPPYEQVKDQIVDFLQQQERQAKMGALKRGLREGVTVEVLLPPYLPAKVEVEALGPSRGPDKAPVTIVEFSDFECPFCGRVEPTIDRILDEYGDQVRLVYRDFPLPMHPNAPKAAEAAHCANDQGKYWEMHRTLFENQRGLQVEKLKQYARDLGLEGTAFDACLDGGKHAELVTASMKAGQEVGVTGTPAFFINGRMISGAQPYERFKELIDHELAQAGR